MTALAPLVAIDKRVGDDANGFEVGGGNHHSEFLSDFSNRCIDGALPRFELAASTDELSCAESGEFFAQ